MSQVIVITEENASILYELLAVLAAAFDDDEHYLSNQPSEAYLKRLLAKDTLIALVYLEQDKVQGGLIAYELEKLEAERSEIYLYDIGVLPSRHRQGLGNVLLDKLIDIATIRGAASVYVQADGDDDVARNFYARRGTELEVSHFDFPIP